MELEKSQKPCRKSQERRKQFERKQNSDKFLINPNMTGNIEYEKRSPSKTNTQFTSFSFQ